MSQSNFALTGSRDILLALGWYYPEVHLGVARYAREHHWHLTCDFDEPIPKRWNGEGVLTLLGAGEKFWRQLLTLQVPMVDLAESRPRIELPRVTMDNAAIAKMAAEYFLDKGFRQFAFVHRHEMGVSLRRRKYFQEVIDNHGYSVISYPGSRSDVVALTLVNNARNGLNSACQSCLNRWRS